MILFLNQKTISQTLIINEVSQGASGSKEYVELVVAWTPSCVTTTPCLDLRNYYIDDNNGTFATGAGTGIATGCIRFKNDPFWSCIPVGTIILIYNDADLNPSVPAPDLSMTDGNCRLIIPVSNCTLLEKNTSAPSTTASSFPTTGFINCGAWSNIGLANADDSFQTLDPNGNLLHAVSWGNNTQNNIVYLTPNNTAGQVAFFTNSGSNNYNLAPNWLIVPVAGNETPGAPNNSGNAAWINLMSNNCQSITPLVVAAQQNLSAVCGCNGSATVSASGSVQGYTYQWTPVPPSGQNTQTATGLCPGSTYKCVVTSAIGCKDSVIFNITGTNAISSSVTGTGLSCFGGSNATATVTFSGGNGGIVYNWSPSPGSGQGTSTAGGLNAQTYTVTVSDVAGCSSNSTFTPAQPVQISSIIGTTPVTCFGGNDGSAAINTFGGTGNFTFSWSPGGATSSTPSSLSAGNYTVTMTDANGCVATNTTTITQPTQLTTTLTSTNVNCNGSADGSANISVSGGTSGYSYSWVPSGGNNSTATNLSAGNYTVTVTDANACTVTATATISAPQQLSASIVGVTNVFCNGGSNGAVAVTVNGGTSGYSYSWAPYGGNGSSATGLIAGNYTCTITDANNCVTNTTTIVTEPPQLTLSVTTQSAPCGGNGGSATVLVSGGVAGYNYLWLPTGVTTPTAVGLTAGTYSCVVTDANSCADTSVVIVGTINGPSVSISSFSNPTCFGSSTGTLVADTSGGVSPFTFSWAPSGGSFYAADSLIAGSYTVTVTDANGCQNFAVANIIDPPQLNVVVSTTAVLCNGQATGSATANVSGGQPGYNFQWNGSANNSNSITGLISGNYSLTVIDTNNCTSGASFTITEPAPIIVGITTLPATCSSANGVAVANVSGGVFPYSYSWSNSLLNSDSISNLSPGNFTLTVTDYNGCNLTQTYTITASGTASLSLTASNNVSCFGLSDGSASVSAAGTPPFVYSWLPAGGNASTASNLGPGTYTCSVSDANNCTATLTIAVSEPQAINVSISSNDALCNGVSNGSASVTATGGTGNYSFAWSPAGGTSATAGGLAAGNYTCTITDASNCTGTSSVTISEPTAINILLSATQINCINTTANINTVISGGTPGYNFTWSPTGSGQNPIGLAAGNYTLSLTDSHGCVATQSVSVTSNINLPNVSAGTDDTLSCLFNSSLNLNGSSSTAGVNYFWTGPNGFSSTSPSPNITSSGVYTLSVSNPQNGCSSTDSVYIYQGLGPNASFSFSPPGGNAPLSVSFTNNSSGAVNYAWNFGNGNFSSNLNDTSSYLIPGTYQITLIVLNAQGCADTLTQSLIVYEEFFLSIPNVFTPNGDGSNDMFFITNKGISSMEVLIFNRWGTMVYAIDSPNGYWDGKTSSGDAPDGTYFFMLTAKGMDGREHKANGYLLLNR